MRNFLYLALVVAALLVCAAGCRQKKPPLEQTKNERTVTGGHTNIVTGHEQGKGAMKALKGTTVSDKQVGYIGMAENAFDLMKRGGDEMYVACKDALERASDAATKRAAQLNWMMITGLWIFAIGAGAMMFGDKFPLVTLAGGVAATVGAIAGVVGFAFQIAEPWVKFGVGALTIFGVGFIVYRTIRKDFESRKLKKELKVERVATKELVETIDAAKPLMPEYVRKEMFGHEKRKGSIHEIQSAPTEALVAKAREEIQKEKNGHGAAPTEAATPITGVVIGTTTGPVDGSVKPST